MVIVYCFVFPGKKIIKNLWEIRFHRRTRDRRVCAFLHYSLFHACLPAKASSLFDILYLQILQHLTQPAHRQAHYIIKIAADGADGGDADPFLYGISAGLIVGLVGIYIKSGVFF